MYTIFVQLLKKTGKKASDVAKATGIPASTFSDWKKGKSSPKIEKLQKIADYFGVTVNYLLTGYEQIEENKSKDTINDKIDTADSNPTYTEMQELIARNGSKLTTNERILLIKLLSELQ